jgi:hypothetical protein
MGGSGRHAHGGAPPRRAIGAVARAELPFATLCLLALLSPPIVLAQGGDWPLALLSFAAVMAVPGAALEVMLGLARAALWIEGGGAGS